MTSQLHSSVKDVEYSGYVNRIWTRHLGVSHLTMGRFCSASCRGGIKVVFGNERIFTLP